MMKYMPCLLDKEINIEDYDAFGHKHFAKALESLIESNKNLPPYSIGLLGKWGTGKSSIKALYLNSLVNNKENTRKRKIKPIIFNAWQYGGENIKRALLRQVYLGLGGNKRNLNDILFHVIQRQKLDKRPFKEVLLDFREMWIWGFSQFIFISLLALAIKFLIGTINGITIGATSIVFIVGNLIIQYIQNPERNIIKRFGNFTQIKPPSSSPEEYEDLLIVQLNKFKKKRSKNCERVVVFVDDLDRLSAEEMVCGLDTIRTFMEIPTNKLPENLGIIFVISCDEDRIAEALANRRKDNTNGIKDGIFDQNYARRFLDRIFQFRLEIPQFPKQDMRNYIIKKLKNDAPEFVQDLIECNINLETIVNRLIHVGVQSPRNALQIINSFLQCWWIARQRESENIEKPGGLQVGAVTNYPETLAALCVLRVDFPDFYKDLQKQSNLINAFIDVFIKKIKLESQDESIQPLLKKYMLPNTEELNNNCRILRQYISSIRDLKNPLSLQPFLLLSQDPLTRKHGTDNAIRVFNALVSGDFHGLLEEFNAKNEGQTLSEDNVLLLSSMEEEIKEQTIEEQKNASIVIGEIVKYLPNEGASIILNPLSIKLIENPDLRFRLGLYKINEIIYFIEPLIRQKIAYCLIDDFLKNNNKIDFKLENGESPTIVQVQTQVIEACSIILSIRKSDGLNKDYDSKLLNWLETRQVISFNEEKITIPFNQVEIWMNQHEDHLLPAFSSGYIELLYKELLAENISDFDLDIALSRCSRAFILLWESRNEHENYNFYAQLNNYITLKMEKAIYMAWNTTELYYESWDSNQVSAFINNFTERINNYLNDPNNWKLENWKNGLDKLISLIERRENDLINQETTEIIKLTKICSYKDEIGDYSIKLLELLKIIDKDNYDKVIEDWALNPLTNLANSCLNWIGVNFNIINQEQCNQITSQLLEICKSNVLSKRQGEVFQNILNNLSDPIILTDSIQEFISNLCSEIPKHIDVLEDYLMVVFPTIRLFIKNGTIPICTMLHTIFTNEEIKPSILGWLHSQMINFWPSNLNSNEQYKPNEIFDFAQKKAIENPGEQYIYEILNSLNNMINQNIVTNNFEIELIDLACALWHIDQNKSQEIILSYNTAPSDLSYILNLFNNIDLSNEMTVNNLSTILSHFTMFLTEEQKFNISINLIENPNDITLRTWVMAQGISKSSFLKTIIANNRLNDGQRKRVWLQAVEHSEELGSKFFGPIIPSLFQLKDAPETIQSIFDSQDKILLTLRTSYEKKSLKAALIIATDFTLSNEAKERLEIWISKIDAKVKGSDINKLIQSKYKEIEQLRVNEFNFSLAEKILKNFYKKSANEMASTKEESK
ncbi:MAG TPA: hypothetical protein DDW50_12045 [Firmicutes bacterium]|jgi:hypothetical protein|nr:hypothetical protein [Bacillota bacterium]